MVESEDVGEVQDDSTPEAERVVSIPVAEALEGLSIVALPDGDKWVGAFMLIKTEAGQGAEGWSARRTEGLSDEELLGVLAVHIERLRDRIRFKAEE